MMIGDSLDVSRETIEQLELFGNLVVKWTTKINLISKSTIPNIWERHIVDSAQVYNLAPVSGKWIDLGAGAGFPGIVAAIISAGRSETHEFIFVESDQRKAVFLRTAIRELNLEAMVISERIEEISSLEADILSARALGELNKLLGYAERHMKNDGTALFPKGQRWESEEDAAKSAWTYECEVFESSTNSEAAILRIKDIARV
jgi:16S rRNA (guanine527-N7)-methyltransferase